ncbi:hypothetical protein NJB14195_14030 [Mycobacterium montefiorense]|nr:hypothetical protein NJB14195_14030 [Mycobacterium montefiorense]GKU61835.1 hypothetical protein NJB18182_23370 [Mycobacterium montefiorense]GKU69019.1 hypothetical protein NJB18183_41650 [Mycobacterium montefiorense]
MRPVEKTPELAAEVAEVMTTKLMIEAAAASPASENIITNGDCPGAICRHGMTHRIASSGPDVEDDYPHRHGVDRTRQGATRISGLCGRRAQQFDTDEGEECDLKAADHARRAGGEEPAVIPQVRQCRVGTVGADEVGAHQNRSDGDQTEDRRDFYQREPEFDLAEAANVEQVQREDQRHGKNGR